MRLLPLFILIAINSFSQSDSIQKINLRNEIDSLKAILAEYVREIDSLNNLKLNTENGLETSDEEPKPERKITQRLGLRGARYNIKASFNFVVIIDEEGNVIDAKNIPMQTSCKDEELINDLLNKVISQVKYEPRAGTDNEVATYFFYLVPMIDND